jgi:hypothetical protein
LEATIKFIQEKGLAEEVDLVTCNTVDTYMSESSWARGYKSYGNFKNAGGNVSKIEVYRGDEAKTVQYFPLVDALMIWSVTTLGRQQANKANLRFFSSRGSPDVLEQSHILQQVYGHIN